VTSAGMLAVGDALEDAVKRARALPALDLGLHFSLTDTAGRPLDLRRLILAWGRGELLTREMAARLRRQLDMLQRVHRLSLSHIALDPSLHAFPPLMRVVSAVAMEYQIDAVRFSSDVPRSLRACARLAHRSVTAYGRRTPAQCLDYQGRLSPTVLSGLLRETRPGITEILCRPGSDNQILRPLLGDEGDWERDLQAVCDDSPRACVRYGSVSLTTWREV
jgi:predicted glycoside hydrolase/deacetylase ChbG (UPF0249 family)